jgi:hypothetical protein
VNLPRVSDGLVTRLEFLLLVLVAGTPGAALYFEGCGDRRGPELQVAHRATVAAEHVLAVRDTVFRHDTVERAIAVGDYRRARAQLVITDTVQVRSTFLKADVALAKDSATLASATSLIAGHVELEGRLRDELAIARPAGAALLRIRGRAVRPLRACPGARRAGTAARRRRLVDDRAGGAALRVRRAAPRLPRRLPQLLEEAGDADGQHPPERDDVTGRLPACIAGARQAIHERGEQGNGCNRCHGVGSHASPGSAKRRPSPCGHTQVRPSGTAAQIADQTAMSSNVRFAGVIVLQTIGNGVVCRG